MPGLLSRQHSESVDFELFSNTILKFTSVLMIVLVLMALNVGQRLDHIISTYRFSGGSARPQFYLGVYQTDGLINNGSEVPITVALESPTFAQTPTKVTEAGTVAIDESNTFSGRYDAPVLMALGLLSAISPGSMLVDGKETPLVVPNFTNKFFQYHDRENSTRRVLPSRELALSLLKLWSDVYTNPVYPKRAFAEFKNSKTRIYVESAEIDGDRNVVVGGTIASLSRVKSGALDFLTGLSSTNTEIIYLGDYDHDATNQTSARVEFFTTHGFVDAAKYLHSILFPGASELGMARNYYERFPTWEQLPTKTKDQYLAKANGDADLAHKKYEAFSARQALLKYRDGLLVSAIKNGSKPEAFALPTPLSYPEAWQAYVDFRLKSEPTPPEWFVTEFLQPLGFDKRVMVIE